MSVRLLLIAGTLIWMVITGLTGCEERSNPVTDDGPVISPPGIVLEPAYPAGLEESYLRIRKKNDSLGGELVLLRESEEIKRFRVSKVDTFIIDDGLQCSNEYTYQVYLYRDSIQTDSSNTLRIRTMDSTSHDFTWTRYDYKNEWGHNFLNDVHIINDNDIWVVGKIGDPSTPHVPFNALHWNGTEWESMKVPSVICGSSSLIIGELETVYAFGPEEVYFSDGGETIRWDGTRFRQSCAINPLLKGMAHKLWGRSRDDLYVIGNTGSLIHYNGTDWQALETDTDVDFLDIWGIPGTDEAWVCGFDYKNGRIVLLKIHGRSVTKIFEAYFYENYSSEIGGSLRSGFSFNPYTFHLLTSEGVVILDRSQLKSKKKINPDGGFLYRMFSIRGSGENNWFAGGSGGSLYHYNGSTLKRLNILNDNDKVISIDVYGKVVVMAGYSNISPFRTDAFIITGYKN